jgi:hypothetical protein
MMVRTQIQIHPEQLRWLRKQAAEKGVSMSQVIRDSIDALRVQVEKPRLLSQKKENALTVVGSFSSTRVNDP